MNNKYGKEQVHDYFIGQLYKFRNRYSRASLFSKIGKVARRAGRDVVYNVLLLYYAVMSGKVSGKDKLLILAALGYFISPADFVPDLFGFIGFTDDLAVFTFVAKTVFGGITPEVQSKARQRLSVLFRETEPPEFKGISETREGAEPQDRFQSSTPGG